MERQGQLAGLLVEHLFHAPVPVALLAVAKLAGLLPISWAWVVLPVASALFFLGSFLLAVTLIRAARACAGL